MLLHVQYRDFTYEDVEARTLDWLLANRMIRQFYRPSEKRWVYVYRDLVRGTGGNYSGPNRRETPAILE